PSASGLGHTPHKAKTGVRVRWGVLPEPRRSPGELLPCAPPTDGLTTGDRTLATDLADWMRARGFTDDDFEVAADALHDEGRTGDVLAFLRASAIVLGDRLRGLARESGGAHTGVLGQARARTSRAATRVKWARVPLDAVRKAAPSARYRPRTEEDRLANELGQLELVRLAGLFVRLLERMVAEGA